MSSPVLSVNQIVHALDNSTPYPVELDRDLLRFMAERLTEMAEIRKRPHEVWEPEEEMAGAPTLPEDPGLW